MEGDVLADTGALLAFLNRRDPWHAACSASYRSLRLPLVTSEAVLAEFFHLLHRNRIRLDMAWTFVLSGAVKLAEITHAELSELNALMSRYSDRPMDFADATLVHLAKRESISTIFTVDRADFETYRIDGRRRFRVLPAARA
jgi:predicted nucleic acid-binding protein